MRLERCGGCILAWGAVHGVSVCLRVWASLLLLLPAVCHADTAILLEDPGVALVERIRLIRSAKEEILLSTFISQNDEANWLLIRELALAARRGVKVKFQVDSLMNNLDPEVIAYLRVAGVEVRAYNPLDWRVWQYPFRNHGKSLVVDRKSVILGGRNQWNDSFALSDHPHRDLEVLLHGEESAKEVARAFDGEFAMSQVVVLRKKLGSATWMRIDALLERYKGITIDDENLPRHEVNNVEFVADRPGERLSTADRLERLLDSATESILIESPWIVLSDRFREALTRATARGVKITVLSNSRQSSERKIRYRMTRVWSAKDLENLGVESWEYQGLGSLHSKYIVIDGRTTFVGSFNFSTSSEFRNMEKGFIFHSPELATAVTDVFKSRVEVSVPARPSTPWRDWKCFHVFAAGAGYLY